MPKSITLTVGTDSTSGPFPPQYPAGAKGYVGAGSNPSGSFAGVLSSGFYYGTLILAIANDAAVPTQFMVAMAGNPDQSFIGNVTTPDGKVYNPSAASYVTYLVNGSPVTAWIWPLAAGGVALVNGTVTIADTGDVMINLTGSSSSSTQIDLTWSNVGPTPPTNYLLYRGIAGVTPTLYQTLSGATLAYSDTGLTANTQYDYAVVATYTEGTKAYSAQQTFFTPASGVSNQFNCNCESQPLPADGFAVDTLKNLRTNLLVLGGYAGQASNPPPGMALLCDTLLRDAQKQLYRMHKEFRLQRFYSWQMEPNVRYYNINQDESGCRRIDPLTVTWVGFEDLNQAWYELTSGIEPMMYTRAQISTGWPTHYDIRSCIEIFPAPKAPYTLWIKGMFGLDPFVDDDDTTTVDAEAVFLLALGKMKAHYKQPDANAILSQAMSYVKTLVAGQHKTNRYIPRTQVNPAATPPRFLPLGNGPA